MICELTYIESDGTNPYRNLAIEEYLLRHVKPEECILYLWQNRHTVVIGYNQNVWKECLVGKLKEDNGHVVRRLSGGGAVFHDLGNLNFTFLVREENYNLEKQLDVILRAVNKLGIHAVKSGRNDITVEGRKFSGNAFLNLNRHCYHHGTLMVDVNVQDLSKYLNVSQEKLRSKGVDSVKARVANLKEFCPELTISLLKEKLLEAFEEIYGFAAKKMTPDALIKEELETAKEKFASWEWIFGRRMEFQYEIETRFPWGGITMQLQVDKGIITDMQIYSDAMEQGFISRIPEYLKGCRYAKEDLCVGLYRVPALHDGERQMMQDIQRFILEGGMTPPEGSDIQRRLYGNI